MIKLKNLITENQTITQLARAIVDGDSNEEQKLRKHLKNSYWTNRDIEKAVTPVIDKLKKSSTKETPKSTTKKWNDREYKRWIKSVQSNGGKNHSYDMAQNAKHEPGLIQFVQKQIRRMGGDETPLERIQWDIES